MLIPSRSGVDLLSKVFNRSMICEGPVGLKDNMGKFGLLGIYDNGSTEEGGIELAIFDPTLEKKLLNSSAIREGSVIIPSADLISVTRLHDLLLVVTSLRISHVFLGSFLQLKRLLA